MHVDLGRLTLDDLDRLFLIPIAFARANLYLTGGNGCDKPAMFIGLAPEFGANLVLVRCCQEYVRILHRFLIAPLRHVHFHRHALCHSQLRRPDRGTIRAYNDAVP